jgi:hypothetical protein
MIKISKLDNSQFCIESIKKLNARARVIHTIIQIESYIKKMMIRTNLCISKETNLIQQ